jgi:hypothetical protein
MTFASVRGLMKSIPAVLAHVHSYHSFQSQVQHNLQIGKLYCDIINVM